MIKLQKKLLKEMIKQILLVVAVVFSFIFIGMYLGTLPQCLPAVNDVTYAMHAKEFIQQKNSIFDFSTRIIHYPVGTAANEGFLILFITRLLTQLINVNEIFALSIALFFLYTLGYAVLLLLLYKMTGNQWLALCFTSVYFLSPLLSSFVSILPLLGGCLILPVSIWLDWKILTERLMLQDDKTIVYNIICFICFVLIRLICCSNSWYVAVMSAVGSVIMLGTFCLLNYKNKKNWLRMLIYGIMPWIIGSGIIARIMPKGTTSFEFGQDIYNASSASILSLFLPTEKQLISQLVPSVESVIPYGMKMSGSQTMTDNYLGIFLLLSALISIVASKKKLADKQLAISLITTSVILLLLSLGPYIKVTGIVKEVTATYSLNETGYVKTLWAFLYNIFPFRMMRAVNRWGIAAKLFFILSASCGIKKLFRYRKLKLMGVVLAFLCIIEIWPARILTDCGRGFQNYKEAEALLIDIGDELSTIIEKNSRIMLLGSSNSYVSSLIATKTETCSYSGSGDKSALLTKKYKPREITQLQECKESDIEKIKYFIKKIKWKKLCDYIVIPFFDSRYDIYSWPPDKKKVASKKILYSELENLKYDTYFTNNFMVVDIRADDYMKGRFELEFDKNSHGDTIQDNQIIKERQNFMGHPYGLLLKEFGQYKYSIEKQDKVQNFYLQMYIKGNGINGNAQLKIEEYSRDNKILAKKEYLLLIEKNYLLYEFEEKLQGGEGWLHITITPSENEVIIKKMVGQIY